LLGIPFFEPIYHESTKVIVDGWPPAFQGMTRVFDSHMGDGFFPVAFDHLKAEIDYLNTVASGTLDLDGVLIDSIRLNHPQGGLGFRFREGKHAMVFITDNELGAVRGKRIPEFVEFVRGCDLLIHDAQYLPEEISERRGWGHSTYEEVVALAREAGVHNLILTHHDPSRSDGNVEKIVALCREMMTPHSILRYVDAAREGACYRLP
jgi:ribonuclease BN (tRNA processing enzyme)